MQICVNYGMLWARIFLINVADFQLAHANSAHI